MANETEREGEVVHGIPAERLGKEVDDRRKDGAEHINCSKENAGTWTIVAIYDE